jgi:hypothetical protein
MSTELERKNRIEAVKKMYNTSISAMAEGMGITRSMIYSWISKPNGVNSQVEQMLNDHYPLLGDAPVEVETKMTMENQDHLAPKPKKAKIETEKKIKEPKPKKIPKDNGPLKNLRCSRKCYFMKVSSADYAKVKPKCPICNGLMMTKEDRDAKN